MANKIIIQGGIILTMVEGDYPRKSDIYIDGTHIVAVGDEEGEPFIADESTTLIDAKGCAIMPGLINTHTHTPMTMMRSTSDDVGYPSPDRPPTLPPDQDWRSDLTPEDHYWSTRLAIAEMIRTGTTTFVDMYHDMDRVAQAVVETGIRGVLGWEILTFRVDPEEWLPYDEATARKTFEESGQFASDWHGKGDGRVTAVIAPHETSTCHEPWLSRSAQLAGEMGLDISIHVAESQWEVDFCREHYQSTPVELLQKTGILQHRVIGAHSIILTDNDISILAQANYSAATCLNSYVKLATSATPVPKLIEAGVNVALGTDSAVTNNNLNMWDEIFLTATLHAFLAKDASLVPKDSALKMATVGGARALGWEHLAGTLEPGKKADVIVIDLDKAHLHPLEGILVGNLIYSMCGLEVRDVLVDGRILMRDSEIIAFNETEVIKQVDRTVRRLRKGVGLPERYNLP
jgi:5-methylthioadenosine/S-adenosylhomocysteine deaminase